MFKTEKYPNGPKVVLLEQQPFGPFDNGQCFKRSNIHLDHLDHYGVSRRQLLNSYKMKQSFRISKGKSKWENFENTNFRHLDHCDLREILDDEVVIEFDSEDRNWNWKAIMDTGCNLYEAGYHFEIWDHGGKSPHLHIHDLPISNLSDDKRKTFKKLFIRKYVDLEFLPKVDFSLTGIHLVAIEYQKHWKGKYGTKVLWGKF